MSVRFICADVMDGLRQLEDESVHCVVTSPPYWSLRDYGVAGQIGLEPTPDAFVAKMVVVFREVRRVLRKDGTLWLNMGDAYCSTAPGTQGDPIHQRGLFAGVSDRRAEASRKVRPETPVGLKPKDLIGMPWRVAFALQADGWWLRSDVVWAKPNPMPESVTDRPTKAHEYVFLLTRAEKYYYDAEAIKETATGTNEHDLTGPGYHAPGQTPQTGSRIGAKGNANTFRGGSYVNGKPGPRTVPGNTRRARDTRGAALSPGARSPHSLSAFEARNDGEYASRNKRSVWTIATAPYSEAHFATFPPALVEVCLKAGTSEHGCCAKCGAPWVREVKRASMVVREGPGRAGTRGAAVGSGQRTACTGTMLEPPRAVTIGWAPSCSCKNADIVPATVLDPFSGAGTTAMVADRLGRDAIGIELNPEYVAMAERRIARDRLDRGKGTMEDVKAAKLPPTPLEALMMEGQTA